MRCLILGGSGMLGHQLLKSWRSRHEVWVTLRGQLGEYDEFGLFHAGNAFFGVEACDTLHLHGILDDYRPQVVINAIGIVKQKAEAKAILPCLEINAALPHRLRLLCQEYGARLIHISTDCVFNGRTGNYTESDPANAEDLYGLTKYLGEVSEAPAVTLRCSMIGLELRHKKSLLEWFLAQRGEVRGFTRTVFSGLTTLEIARVIEQIMLDQPKLTGLWQVGAAPISKYELLCKLAASLDRQDMTIVPDDSLDIDRSLSSSAFAIQTGYQAPSWDQMLGELADQILTREPYHVAA